MADEDREPEEGGGEEPDRDAGPAASADGGPAAIEILESDSVIRTLEGPAEAGVNRVVWALERRGFPRPGADEDDPEPAGPEVVPGTYGVRVTVGDHVAEGTVEVLQDPRT
ncbi:MAG: hypothetical protein GWM90_00455, partial [Gemmatimonadetes bacterium]|nr:hypothetical protein [Gemmatimonadota bacterium]NIQ51993.1 hypothetical protein [Gemmatimonadota bacterium]NIU72093.1 hypothetical protein [Gammaproteobacteria bacterium]NIX42656.1 hypothetical protein [Gemmatimonadota bacterium]NIY06817.1 hypothetical protein [Gemmatimonadota bacterium]